MRYAILFHDAVVGHSAFEQAHVIVGLAEGHFEPTAAFERLRPLLPPNEYALDTHGMEVDNSDWGALSVVHPAFERIPLRVADHAGRLINARVCGLGAVAAQMLVVAWINDEAFWRGVAEG
jgi:hypothetical protein